MAVENSCINGDGGEGSDAERLVPNPDQPEVRQIRRLVLLEIGTFLYFLALVTQYPVVQFWLFDHFAREYKLEKRNESDLCPNSTQVNSSYSDLEAKVQSEANKYVMLTSFTANFVAIFPTLLFGPLTDKYGRKFVFYISSLGLFANLLLALFIFHFDLMPQLLFVTCFLLGLSGSYGLFLTATFGVVADITSPGKQRVFRVATVEASIAIASSLGITLSGIWVKEIGYSWPIAISMAEVVLVFLFYLFFIPETFVSGHYHPFSCKTLLRSVHIFVKDTPNKRRFKLIISVVCFLTCLGAFIGESNFSLLYLLHQPFCWPKTQISIFSGAVTLLKWICVMSFIILGKNFISEPVFAIIGSTSAASCYLLKGLATSDLLIYIGAGASLLMDIVSPMCRTMMSRAVSTAEQGALFAGIGVLQMVVSAVAGIAMSSVYSVGLDFFLGLPYVVLAGVVSVNIFLLIGLIIRTKLHPEWEQSAGERDDIIVS